MAILNAGILGTARNKIGNMVAYRLKGQNVARVYVDQISNPQSDAQMRQRAKLINLVAAYRANQFWMHYGAFENKQQKWSDYNAFVSANTDLQPVFLTREQVAAGAGIVQPFTVSRGSLYPISAQADEDALLTNISLGTADSARATTIGELSSGIIANNPDWRNGDQLSIVINLQRISDDGTPMIVARAYEIILNTQSNANVADLLGTPITIESLPGDPNGYISLEDGFFGTTLWAATLVHTRDEGGVIKNSPQSLQLSPALAEFANGYQTDSAFQSYLDSYGGGGANFLSAGYSGLGSTGGVELLNEIVGATIDGREFRPGGERPYVDNGSVIVLSFSEQPSIPTSVRLFWGADAESQGRVEITSGFTVGANTLTFTIPANANLGDFTPVAVGNISVTMEGRNYELTFASA